MSTWLGCRWYLKWRSCKKFEFQIPSTHTVCRFQGGMGCESTHTITTVIGTVFFLTSLLVCALFRVFFARSYVFVSICLFCFSGPALKKYQSSRVKKSQKGRGFGSIAENSVIILANQTKFKCFAQAEICSHCKHLQWFGVFLFFTCRHLFTGLLPLCTEFKSGCRVRFLNRALAI